GDRLCAHCYEERPSRGAFRALASYHHHELTRDAERLSLGVVRFPRLFSGNRRNCGRRPDLSRAELPGRPSVASATRPCVPNGPIGEALARLTRAGTRVDASTAGPALCKLHFGTKCHNLRPLAPPRGATCGIAQCRKSLPIKGMHASRVCCPCA